MSYLDELLGQPTANDPGNWAGYAKLFAYTGGNATDPYNWTGISQGNVSPAYADYLVSQGQPDPLHRTGSGAAPGTAAANVAGADHSGWIPAGTEIPGSGGQRSTHDMSPDDWATVGRIYATPGPTSINGPAEVTPTASGAPPEAVRTPAPPVTNTTVSNPTAPAAEQFNRRGFDDLAAMLHDADLDALFKVDANGMPSGWLWDQIVTGTVNSRETLQVAIEATDAFKQRYPVIGQLRQSHGSYIPSVSQVRDFEDGVARMMRDASVPVEMWDSFTEKQDLMARGFNLPQLEERFGQSWQRVNATDPHVRQAFTDFFGAQGDSMLAAMWLDPNYTLSNLDRMSRSAYTGGMGRAMGINVDKAMAGRLADLPKTEAGYLQDYGEINRLSGVFDEEISETTDLTKETTGIGAVSLGDAEAQDQIARRIGERQAANRSTSGGAAVTQTGVIGLGQQRG